MSLPRFSWALLALPLWTGCGGGATAEKGAENAVARGNSFYASGDYPGAIAQYSEAIRLDPGNAAARQARGEVYFASAGLAKGNRDIDKARDYTEKAIADFDVALEIDPALTAVWFNRGRAHADKGDVDRAIADYSEAVARDAAMVSAFVNRGVAYARKDALEKAAADFDAAIRLAPKHVGAHFNRGMIRFQQADWDRAIADFSEVIRLAPDDAAPAYTARGDAYEKKGDDVRAAADYAQAERLKR
jgi:tetratricopeptide (TPR) repeat protein